MSNSESKDIIYKVILKDSRPAYLVFNHALERDGQSIVVPVELQEMYEHDLAKFVQVYRKINSYLSQDLSATNYHTVQLGLF